MKLPSIAEIRKAIVAVLGVASLLVSTGYLHGTALTVVNACLAAATALGVYVIPNKTTPTVVTVAAGPSVAEAVLAPDTSALTPTQPPARMGSDPMAAVANSGVVEPPVI